MPLSKISEGTPMNESCTVSVPDLSPSAAGAKVTVILQVWSNPKGEEEMQLLISV